MPTDIDTTVAHSHDGLDIACDMRYQRGAWVVNRVGWGIIAALIAAAALGLLGSDGPLNERTIGSSLRVTYAPVLRHKDMTTIHVQTPAGEGDTVQLWLDRTYADAQELDRIVPEPLLTEVGPERVVYHFKVASPDAPVTVTLAVNPDGYWRQHVGIGLVGGEEHRFSQLVLP